MTAIEYYEAALMAAFPEGASGKVFEHWNAARIAQAAPEGWKLVPIEPTTNMLCEMERQWMVGSQIDMAKREWKAALAAAPKPEAKS